MHVTVTREKNKSILAADCSILHACCIKGLGQKKPQKQPKSPTTHDNQ